MFFYYLKIAMLTIPTVAWGAVWRGYCSVVDGANEMGFKLSFFRGLLWCPGPGRWLQRKRYSALSRQGWKTSAHVREHMAHAGANGLSTITNLEKMATEIPVHERSNGIVKPPQMTLGCYPARGRIININ